VCLAAFTIDLDTTIVNVMLPTLVRDLDAPDGDQVGSGTVIP
jgi:hypothetical protein